MNAMETPDFDSKKSMKRSKSVTDIPNEELDLYQLNRDNEILRLQLKLVEENLRKEESMSRHYRKVLKQGGDQMTELRMKNCKLESANQGLLEEIKSLRNEVIDCNRFIASKNPDLPVMLKDLWKLVQSLGDENPRLKNEIKQLQRENTQLSRKNSKAVTFLKEWLESEHNDALFESLLPEIIRDVSKD
jgi:predicted RNase H-like nuclease (RuvC/YqgF family)